MNADPARRQVAADPQTKPTDFGCGCYTTSKSIVAVYYYYLAVKLMLI